MRDRYRILDAALSSGEQPFSVLDLANASGVNLATVRTVLSRDAAWFSVRGNLEAGGRGGRYKLYVLSDLGKREISGLLSSASPISKSSRRYCEPPPSLLSVEDLLLRQIPESEDAEEIRLNLRLAGVEVLAAKELLSSATGQEGELLKARAGLAETVLHLLVCKHQGDSQQHAIERIELALRSACDSLMQLDDAMSDEGPSFEGLAPAPVVQTRAEAFAAAAGGRSAQVPEPGKENFAEFMVLQFTQARADACRAENVAEGDELPAKVLTDASRLFMDQASVASSTTAEQAFTNANLANDLRNTMNPGFPIQMLPVLAKEPAIFDKGAVTFSSGGIRVNSIPFRRASQKVEREGQVTSLGLAVLASR